MGWLRRFPHHRLHPLFFRKILLATNLNHLPPLHRRNFKCSLLGFIWQQNMFRGYSPAFKRFGTFPSGCKPVKTGDKRNEFHLQHHIDLLIWGLFFCYKLFRPLCYGVGDLFDSQGFSSLRFFSLESATTHKINGGKSTKIGEGNREALEILTISGLDLRRF